MTTQAKRPSWIRSLPDIIHQARSLVVKYDDPDTMGDIGPYTHTDDMRCCVVGGLSIEEWGGDNGAYHLVISPQVGEEDEFELDMPVLEVKIRPQRFWLDKLAELAAETRPVPSVQAVDRPARSGSGA